MTDRSMYTSPLESRYAGREMRTLFGDQKKFSTWRKLWLELAKCQKELGLNIRDEQIAQMAEHLYDIDFDAAASYERKLRHDVMAHIHAFSAAAPAAKAIIHLGATSQYVNDNTDLILMRDGLNILIGLLANIVASLSEFAQTHRDTVCLAFTHYQPAQLTTVGKRAVLWCQDFIMDLRELEYRLSTLEFRGVKGTTGTQASFLALFDGDHEKVKKLDAMIAERFGFARACPVTGQTYSRKIDAAITSSLGGIGASVHKFCNDIRLLSNLREIEEPSESSQVGSSAMAYKRNPMRCERATGLARWLISICTQPLQTAAEQWFERTLDDSANKRLAIPEAFLTADACLRIVLNVTDGLVVRKNVIAKNFVAELQYMATENILMAAVRAGGDRQELHERIRVHSQKATEQVKEHGKSNDLLDRLRSDPAFARVDFDAVTEPRAYVGRAPEQVNDFIASDVVPVLAKYAGNLGLKSELNV